MPKTKKAPSEAAVAEERTVLQELLDSVRIPVPEESVEIDAFRTVETAGEQSKGAMMAAALRVFLAEIARSADPVERIDKVLVDSLIADIDGRISRQLDEILHHETFQAVESTWRGLKLLVDRTDFRKNVVIELLNASKDDLRQSFDESPELIQSPLYRKVYAEAYDQPGAHPISTIVTNYEFESSPQDIALLENLSKVGAAAHAPVLGAVGPSFFGQDDMESWKKVPDLTAYMSTNDYIRWNSFRKSPDSRYVGLVFPRFLLRLPYGADTHPTNGFNYEEQVKGPDHGRYLWGNATFAMASGMVRAFVDDGWCVQIRGPQSGGKVESLPMHQYDVGKGKQLKVPTEVPLDETLDFEASKLGFIPLSWYENEDFACFFSANSTQHVDEHPTKPAVTANRRINARLPYVLLASRLAHYLKVQQRQNIGSNKSREVLEQELNEWIQTLVGEMRTSDPAYLARYPLRAAQIGVEDVEGNPGFYRVTMMVLPRFQIEGMDVNLAVVGQLPTGQ